LKAEEKRFLSINQALTALLRVEEKKKNNVITPETVAVGVARAGSNEPTLKADFIKNLLTFDFGEPPYSLIFTGDLHFMEAEALIVLAKAPKEFKRLAK
jgi:diphthine synthase